MNSYYGGDGWFYKVLPIKRWETLKYAYQLIKSIPYIPKFYFPKSQLVKLLDLTPYVVSNKIPANQKPLAKKQFLDFLVKMNLCGFCHNDLNYENVLFKDKNIYVIDWDTIKEFKGELRNSPDIIGRINIFSPTHRGISLAAILQISQEEIFKTSQEITTVNKWPKEIQELLTNLFKIKCRMDIMLEA